MVAIGIDIGNVNARVALAKSESGKVRAEVIDNDEGKRFLRSCIAFAAERQFGETALQHIDENNIVYGVLEAFDRLRSEGSAAAKVAFQVLDIGWREGASRSGVRRCWRRWIDVAAVHEDASADKDVRAVISVPASFTSSERQAIKDAAAIAGLKAVRLVNDTTAAAVAYAMQRPVATAQTLIICNFGGGSSAISIVTVRGTHVEVLATAGDSQLGGVDFDRLLTEHLAEKYANGQMSPSARRLLKTECEKAKEKLSRSISTRVAVEVDGFKMNSVITRDEFEHVCDDLFVKFKSLLDDCLSRAPMQPSNVDQILLLGGCSRLPKLREIVSAALPGKGLNQTVNVDEAVVSGAALLAASLWLTEGGRRTPSEICGRGVYVVSSKGECLQLVAHDKQIPAAKTSTVSHACPGGFELRVCDGFSEDRLVECASTKTKFLTGPSSLDITVDIDADGIVRAAATQSGSLQIDVAVTGVRFAPRRSNVVGYAVFCEGNEHLELYQQDNLTQDGSHVFRTLVDGQERLELKIHEIREEGHIWKERKLAHSSLSFFVDINSPVPKGAGVTVTFTMAPDGEVQLRAMPLKEVLREDLPVSEACRSLTNDEIKRMRNDVMAFRLAETKREQLAKAKNELEAYLIATAKRIEEKKEQLSNATRMKLDLERARQKLERLSTTEKIVECHQGLAAAIERELKTATEPKSGRKEGDATSKGNVATESDLRPGQGRAGSSYVTTPPQHVVRESQWPGSPAAQRAAHDHLDDHERKAPPINA
ncbi:heat-shock inducible Hsp70 [Aphelenchoides avenae]|nr:heat-shock inducible Hsp70 [Aphelenchus avenae]